MRKTHSDIWQLTWIVNFWQISQAENHRDMSAALAYGDLKTAKMLQEHARGDSHRAMAARAHLLDETW